jgi:hypothetical protein
MAGSNYITAWWASPGLLQPLLHAELLSDVANGGQVLLDETTFSLVKDSLAVLGTVSDSGYDDAMLQALMRGQVVEKMRRQVACAALCVR